MKKPLTIIITSPTDVQAERDLLPIIIGDLNTGIADAYNVFLDPKGWNTAGYPSISPEDGKQQEQVELILPPSKCDLLIAVLWTRFGTSEEGETDTKREIELAYESLKAHGSPQLFLYFNQKSHTPRTTLQATRLADMLRLKDNFKKKGFIWEYEGELEFERLVRRHLTNFIIQRHNRDTSKQLSAERDKREKRISELYKSIGELSKKDSKKSTDPSDLGRRSQEKGHKLESLVEEIFNSIEGFSVQRNVKTDNEEFDLIVFNRRDDSSWRDEGYIIAVECKNWDSDKVNKDAFQLFYSKIEHRCGRCKLGFLIGTGNLAKTVRTSMHRSCKGPILVVPLDGDDLHSLVDPKSDRSQLLRNFVDRALFT